MSTQFKAGDRVLITKPTKPTITWPGDEFQLNIVTLKVACPPPVSNKWYVKETVYWWFSEDWMTKIRHNLNIGDQVSRVKDSNHSIGTVSQFDTDGDPLVKWPNGDLLPHYAKELILVSTGTNPCSEIPLGSFESLPPLGCPHLHIKEVSCGIGPSAQPIMVCCNCKEEV